MNDILYNTLKKKDYLLKNYIIKVAHELSLSFNDVLLLVYFTNQDKATLDLEDMSNNLYLTNDEIMESYQKLVELNLIEIKTKKDKNGIINETIDLDNIIKSVTLDISKEKKNNDDTNIYEVVENEFGRTLSPMEYEIISTWLNEYDHELIYEAIKEASFSNAKSLRYISKILSSWKDKGFKKKEDIKRINKEDNNIDLFEYDWLDDNHE